MRSLSRFLATFVLLVVVASVGQQAAHAASVSQCSGVVCEDVVFSGTTVTQWLATVYPGSGYHCRTARFWVNGGLIDQRQVCGTAGLAAYANTPYTLPSGSRLCASWIGESGYPCISI